MPHHTDKKFSKQEGHPDSRERGTPRLSLRVVSCPGSEKIRASSRADHGEIAADVGIRGVEEHRTRRLEKSEHLRVVHDWVGHGVVDAVVEPSSWRLAGTTLVLHDAASRLVEEAIGLWAVRHKGRQKFRTDDTTAPHHTPGVWAAASAHIASNSTLIKATEDDMFLRNVRYRC